MLMFSNRDCMRMIYVVSSMFLASFLCFGQATIVGPKSAKYGDVILTIGMSRTKVLQLFDASSIVTLNKVSDANYGVYQKDLVYITQPLGSVHFEKDVVNAASVEEGDLAEGRDAERLFNNIYTGIQKLKSKECKIETFVDPNPKTKVFKVIVICGAETMQIMSVTVEDQARMLKTVRVSRVIQ